MWLGWELQRQHNLAHSVRVVPKTHGTPLMSPCRSHWFPVEIQPSRLLFMWSGDGSEPIGLHIFRGHHQTSIITSYFGQGTSTPRLFSHVPTACWRLLQTGRACDSWPPQHVDHLASPALKIWNLKSGLAAFPASPILHTLLHCPKIVAYLSTLQKENLAD